MRKFWAFKEQINIIFNVSFFLINTEKSTWKLGNLPDNVATINYRIPILRIVNYAVVFQNSNLTYTNWYVLFCTIICIIFTSLCKNLVKLTWVLAEAFWWAWKWCTWHRKASAKNSSKFNKFLAKGSENNTYYSAK